MSPVDFSMMFVLGLVSSLHCVQMCGPIVLSYSVALESLMGPATRSLPRSLIGNHIAYNAGRILTYSALGAIAGFAGQTVSVLARISGLTHVLVLIAGFSMIVAGVAISGAIPGNIVANRLLRVPTSFLRRAATLINAPRTTNRFVLGLLLGFLPCGLVYGVLLKAMATGAPVYGALTMLAFGLGSAGSLVAVGTLTSSLRLRLNRWGKQLAAVGITLMGVLLVWRGTIPSMMMMEQHMHGHH